MVALVFVLVAGKYVYDAMENALHTYKERKNEEKIEAYRQSYICPKDLNTIVVDGGKVCRPSGVQDSVYRKIFDSYAFKSGGKEQIYSFLSEGTLQDADMMIDNQFPVDRYGVTKLQGEISWEEDPFREKYWRFLFYGFRPMRNLFYAFDETNDSKYLQKASDITVNFIRNGQSKPYAWDDFHAVAFRTMFMTKTWWQLRSNNLLTYDTSKIILKSLEAHGTFLADPNHYDKGYNHGLNEATALYVLAINFPDLPHAQEWLALSKDRLSEGLINVVDKDGVLIENSPYYHLYTLEKYWEIYHYAQEEHAPISEIFNVRMKEMVAHATYILQPNREVPLLGASIKRKILYSGIYKDIADAFPEFKYVLTAGKFGKKPSKLNIVFPESGEVIMRSGWGEDRDFKNETQVIFDGGPYRTAHSDLDALSFSLYSNGFALMPDAGLYTYDENDYQRYFNGTASHNTVTVDDLDQERGSAVLGDFLEGKDFVAQSATSQLYRSVTHARTLALLGEKYLLIVDKLTSDDIHTYKQLFHVFPGAKITTSGTTVKVFSPEKDGVEEISIFQLLPDNILLDTAIDQKNPPRGLCSQEYGKVLPCHSIEYTQKAKDARYITVIELGKHDPRLKYQYHGTSVTVEDSSKKFSVNLTDLDSVAGGALSAQRALPASNTAIKTKIEISSFKTDWEMQGKGKAENYSEFLELRPEAPNEPLYITIPAKLDLSEKNLLLKMRVFGRSDVGRLEIKLSTNQWAGSIVSDLKNAYREEYAGEWLTVSLGKGSLRRAGGQWREYGQGFDWSNIDAIRIGVGTKQRAESLVQLSNLSMTPEGKEGEVVIIFDDGYESILPAVEVMHKYGFKGNIAVIADRVEDNQRGYLSLKQLKMIKNIYGWDLINHSQHHVGALDAYVHQKDLEGFEQDILSGAKFLSENDLNTAPNWYIYPHGETNRQIKDVVAKYYTFARTTINQPETYPFGDPLGVKTISADALEASGVSEFTSADYLLSAVRDAKKYKLPLFITFHRIHSTATDRPGYKIKDFDRLMGAISQEEIKVKTLSQFDADHQVPERHIQFISRNAPQLGIGITLKNISLFKRFFYGIEDIFYLVVSFLYNIFSFILRYI